jgi:glucose/arabinose dehydrogenase
MKSPNTPLFFHYILLLFALLLLVTGIISAQPEPKQVTLPTGFSQTQITSTLNRPTTMRFAPDGRLFIAQQSGEVRVVVNDVLQETPVITLNVLNQNEAGLVGLALDPDFATNNYMYLYYTVPAVPDDPITGENEAKPPHNRISRFTLNGNVADPLTEVTVLDLDDLVAAKPGDETRHMGGAMNFGADGKLYAAVGDNFDPANAQSLENVKGKILRINADGSIPEDNPFYDQLEGNNRAIWAFGLRNPYSMAIQPGTGKMLFNDVGEEAWEEINEGVAGANYGWPIIEGPIDEADPEPVPPDDYVDPLYALPHPAQGCISFVGAAFYNPVTVQFPEEYAGDYFYGEFCADWIESYDPQTDQSTRFLSTGALNPAPTDLQISPDGALYYSGLFGGLWKITYSEPPTPTSTATSETPTSTATSEEPVTPTPTDTGSVNLVENGGFEARDVNNNPVIAPWAGKNLTRDKIKCNTTEKTFSRSGECAFRFKGSNGAKVSLKQNIDITSLVVNNFLVLQAWVQSKNLTVETASVRLIVKFPTAEKSKTVLLVDPNLAVYTELTADSILLVEAPDKVKVELRSQSSSGKLLVDDVALYLYETSGVLPLPLAQ